MQPLQFALAILLLLATPGPTNTLLWLSGAAAGLRRSAPLLLGELGGYLTVVVPVAALTAPFISAHPEIGLIVKLAAASWILLMAHALWTAKAHDGAERPITLDQVFITTVVNPKGLIIALAIMPQAGLVAMLPWLAGFAVLVVSAGSLWIIAGTFLARLPRRPIGQRLPRRVTAACLVVFSFGMAGSALASML
ncbi:LysE family translocator [Sinorhizobium terangae]|uniref:Threonine transporter RhtB n=1 Tax=Sinorhizobium terangae TaxID=110322 RepID=A0A6N7LB95_SINTE|nr:threonine transporter RhtB [Sinorhizobium terangae]MBB4183852.1 threonine/homoserine/homoserine lactone efflux protein [Sinorhizobium terangae]MQX15121.1 threonine transporter RhtB [Sinorhizobium terangae]WFU47992.1 threonine transporter RhtB [Sinorhizobium terangae]